MPAAEQLVDAVPVEPQAGPAPRSTVWSIQTCGVWVMLCTVAPPSAAGQVALGEPAELVGLPTVLLNTIGMRAWRGAAGLGHLAGHPHPAHRGVVHVLPQPVLHRAGLVGEAGRVGVHVQLQQHQRGEVADARR